MDSIAAPPDPTDTLVALSPADMAVAQTDLATWCAHKIEAVKRELADLETNLELATEHGWKHESVEASLRRCRKRVDYYEKIRLAVEAGYVIVPNFPIDAFAVRVKRGSPRYAQATYEGSSAFNSKAEQLPAGEGRYVDDRVFTRSVHYTEEIQGKQVPKTQYLADSYDDVDFPVTLVKPAILQATGRAMALRLFDEMGTVSNQVGRDPIVVGRLLDPRGNRRCVTFFVAWWLDPETL
jgi:hypothetical protein